MAISRLRVFLSYRWEYPALFLFLFTLPFSLRNVLWTFSPQGAFNEYTDISLYLSDLTLATLGLALVLKYKTEYKSTNFKLFHVEHWYFILLIVWASASILWAPNTYLAMYGLLKILEGVFLFLTLNFILRSRGEAVFHVEHSREQENNKCSTWNMGTWLYVSLVIAALFQAFIALAQFIFQKSVGLHVFGESLLSRAIPGVAEVIVGDQTLLRAYGLFPHPNVLGGFLSITLLISIIYPLLVHKKLFHVEHIMSRILLKISVGMQFLALLSTFSKSAIAGFVFALIFFSYQFKKMFHVEHLEQGYLSKGMKARNMFHVEQFLVVIASALLIIAIFWWINTTFLVIQPLQERLFAYYSLLKLSLSQLFFGLGSGQYVYVMQDFYSQNLEEWQFQPIHNLFLLILAELGLIGLATFCVMLYYLFFRESMFHVEHAGADVPRGTNLKKIFSQALLLALLFPALTDHYWWDIQQGQLLFWLTLGFAYWLKIDK